MSETLGDAVEFGNARLVDLDVLLEVLEAAREQLHFVGRLAHALVGLVGSGHGLLLVADPLDELGGLAHQPMRVAGLLQLSRANAAQFEQLAIGGLDLLLSQRHVQTRRRRRRRRLMCRRLLLLLLLLLLVVAGDLDALDVGGGHEALSLVDLHLPPVLVGRVEQREHVALAHTHLARTLLRIVVQHDHTLSLATRAAMHRRRLAASALGRTATAATAAAALLLLHLAALVGRLAELGADGVRVGLDVGHEGGVLLLQRLGRVLVAAVVVRVDERSLLAHPRLALARVGQVLLHVKGLVEQLLALSGAFAQRLPLALQRHAALLDVGGGEVSALDHVLGLVARASDARLVRLQLADERLMPLTHVLHADEVARSAGRAATAGAQRRLLVAYPRLLVVDVAQQLLQLQRLGQLGLASLQRLVQRRVLLGQQRLMLAYVGRVEVSGGRELSSRLLDGVDALLARRHVGLELLELLLQVEHGREVLAELVDGQLGLALADPQQHVVHVAVEGLGLDGLAQSLALGLAGVHQAVPLVHDGARALSDALGGVVVGVDERLARLAHGLDARLMRAQLGLEGGVTVLLGRQVARVHVLVRLGDLELLARPAGELVAVALEHVQLVGLGQLHAAPLSTLVHGRAALAQVVALGHDLGRRVAARTLAKRKMSKYKLYEIQLFKNKCQN